MSGPAFFTEFSARASCASVAGAVIDEPSGSLTTATSGAAIPPLPYCCSRAWLASYPGCPGSEKSFDSTPESPGAAMKPMTVTTAQNATTINLWRSTHRVRFSTCLIPRRRYRRAT